MSSEMIHYLLIFDHKTGQLVTEEPFSDAEQAVAAYQDAEAKHFTNRAMEIVLVGADSIDTIRKTHGHYFDGSAKLAAAEAFLRAV